MAPADTLVYHHGSRTTCAAQPPFRPPGSGPIISRKHHRPRTPWTAGLFSLACFASVALGSSLAETTVPITTPIPTSTSTSTSTSTPTLTSAEGLVIDTRIPVLDRGSWTIMGMAELDLRRRALSGESVTTTFEITISPSKVSTSSALQSSEQVTLTSSSSPTSTSATTLPRAFDGGLSNNFTSSVCPTFINEFLNSDNFTTCYPVSLLLQSSTSFFQALKSIVSTTQVLDRACAASATYCSDYLTTLAKNLTDAGNCGADYDRGNPTVVQAYVGLVAYQAVYSATCLKDPDTSVYCFANAATNTTNPTETYFYYLPLNMSLPGGTVPICGECLSQTMDIYQIATANRKQPIAYTYGSAAQQVNTICGPSFVNQTLPNAIVTNSAFSALSQGPSWLLVSSLLVVTMNWII